MTIPPVRRPQKALEERIGEPLDRFKFPLDATLIDEFRASLRACGDNAPPTVLQAAALHRQVVPHLELGFDPALVRHAAQRYLFTRDPGPAMLDVAVRVGQVYTRTGVTGPLIFATIVSEFTDSDGPVATAEMTVVELPSAGNGVARHPPAEPLPRWQLTREVEPLTPADLRRYAAASGDLNPIHTDEQAAIAAGLPGVVVMGMLPGGVLAAFGSEVLGQTLGELSLRFRAPIWPGEPLSLAAQPKAYGYELRLASDSTVRISGAVKATQGPQR
jgi:acyl dehydratase